MSKDDAAQSDKNRREQVAAELRWAAEMWEKHGVFTSWHLNRTVIEEAAELLASPSAVEPRFVQEPVAWRWHWKNSNPMAWVYNNTPPYDEHNNAVDVEPLYGHPWRLATPSPELPPVMESCGGSGRSAALGVSPQFPVHATPSSVAPLTGETARTDRRAQWVNFTDDLDEKAEIVDADFARQLERELAEANRVLRIVRGAAQSYKERLDAAFVARSATGDAKDAARYRFVREEGLLDGHVVAYEDDHDLDESAHGTHDYTERCDAAVDEMMQRAMDSTGAKNG